jgi:hypothetical protein
MRLPRLVGLGTLCILASGCQPALVNLKASVPMATEAPRNAAMPMPPAPKIDQMACPMGSHLALCFDAANAQALTKWIQALATAAHECRE